MGIIDFDLKNCVDGSVLKKYLLKDYLMLTIHSTTADNFEI